MPKIGMEAIRKAALVEATIAEVGSAGSLDVTVAAISRRAGVSSALAHHYFGSKEQIFLAAMRHILTVYSAQVREALGPAEGPVSRLNAIVRASFEPMNFRADVISAWLNFYVLAQTSPEARRLLDVYQRRLHSNLMHALRKIMPPSDAQRAARGIAGLIDGVYIRQALDSGPVDRGEAAALVLDYLAMVTGGATE